MTNRVERIVMRALVIELFEAIDTKPIHSLLTDQDYWHAFPAELFERQFAFCIFLNVVLGVFDALLSKVALRLFAHTAPTRRVYDNLSLTDINARRIVRYPFVSVYPKLHFFRRVRSGGLIGEVNLAALINPPVDLRPRGTRRHHIRRDNHEDLSGPSTHNAKLSRRY